MKTMSNQDGSSIVRISDDKAKILEHEGFHYVQKEVWKKKIRDDSDTPDYPYNVEYGTNSKPRYNKLSKATKRHMRTQS